MSKFFVTKPQTIFWFPANSSFLLASAVIILFQSRCRIISILVIGRIFPLVFGQLHRACVSGLFMM